MKPIVAVIAPGNMGAAVGARLVAQGLEVLTSLAGRSPASAERAAAAGMRPAADAEIAQADFLLSIVPLLAIVLVALSHVVNEESLIHAIAINLELLTPGYAEYLADQVRIFLANRHLVGVVGFIIMLFFSSMAFSVLESTMAVIFSHRRQSMRR